MARRLEPCVRIGNRCAQQPRASAAALARAGAFEYQEEMASVGVCGEAWRQAEALTTWCRIISWGRRPVKRMQCKID